MEYIWAVFSFYKPACTRIWSEFHYCFQTEVTTSLVSLPSCHKESGMLPDREDPSQHVQMVRWVCFPPPKNHCILFHMRVSSIRTEYHFQPSTLQAKIQWNPLYVHTMLKVIVFPSVRQHLWKAFQTQQHQMIKTHLWLQSAQCPEQQQEQCRSKMPY